MPQIHVKSSPETFLGSLDSSVGIATGYRLEGPASIPGRDKKFSLLQKVQTGSRTHPALLSNGHRGLFPGDKAAGT
jgi:hypothetical protein